MTVGERIKKVRAQLGWSRGQLSDETGIPYRTLANYESGDQRGSTPIDLIATALGVDPLWLSNGTGNSGLHSNVEQPDKQPPTKLAGRIKEARIAAGLNIAQLARLCGISSASMHDLESGKSQSTRQDTLLHLSKALGRSPEWLAFGDAQGIGQTAGELPHTSFEKGFMADFRKLSGVEQKVVVRMVRSLAIDK